MRILLVEDDHLQAEGITAEFERAFPGAKVQTIATESDFVANLNQIADNPPDVIIIDVMLRWADPAPDLKPPPPEVQEGGFFRAGIRCKDMLQRNKNTDDIPVVVYTVLDRSDLPEGLEFIPKGANFRALVNRIREVLEKSVR